jgi:2,4-dienoyl-CoA reductase-like NADH-dependent reductase (Old Yellow Enzyme family)/thioredoxin reductase
MKLLEPIEVGPMTFKNRIYHLPIGTPGHRGETALNYYKARARGGVAALTTGGLANMEILRHPTAELKRFAQEIKETAPDCYVGTQTLAIYGPEKPDKRPYTPSGSWSLATKSSIALDWPDPRPIAITTDIMYQYTEWMAEAAYAQREAGFDFVELHATHAYIWRQFLSPMDNKREDEHGGSIENRSRWMCDTVAAIRKAAGDDFGILFRLAAMEPEQNGISLADSCRAAQLLEEAGVDALIISEGANSHNRGFIASCVPLMISYDRNCFAHWAEAIKKVVDVPVMAVGRITRPDEAEAILETGQADIIGLARALMADPEWANKAASGSSETITPCLGCNTCFDYSKTGGGFYDHMTCSVNARLCDEGPTEYGPAERTKEVMVIGSGPAGMEAARVAAERGHHVTLYEQADRLGGLLHAAASGHGKQDVDEFRKYLTTGVTLNGVKIELDTKVDKDLVARVNPDALVVAIGAKPRGLDVLGMKGDNLVPAETAITGEVPVGQKVLVVGGGMVGLEAAEHLANNGHAVTLVARSGLASDYTPLNRGAIVDAVAMSGVISYEHVTVEDIAPEGVRVTIEGKTRLLEADTIVLAIGSDADESFIDSLREIVEEIHVVGDANGNARFREAMIEGHEAGRTL